MIVNKKFDRFKQWAGERMGGEIKTNLSDNFKALETEMNVKHEGVDRIHKSLISYIKSISKRSEGDDKEKTLPIAHLGGSMVGHGEDFDANSDYGRCLTMFGRAEERIARVQESYISQATSSYLESLERSLAQMKEYQAARKKLDSRRLAYDATLSKMQKAKKEDFRVEEELRTQKVKYEEANEDVFRRMQDIKDSEVDGVADLTAFLEAQLNYHERCQEVLLQLKNDWVADQHQAQTPNGRRTGRARSNTAHSYRERYEPLHEESTNGGSPRPIIRSDRHPSSAHMGSPARETYPADSPFQRPVLNRTSTFEGPSQLRQVQPSSTPPWQSRAPSENFISRRDSSQTRPISMMPDNPYNDPYEEPATNFGGNHDGFYSGRPSPPNSAYGDVISRRASSATLNGAALQKKAPPPPPPSRAKKPPPPPPMKRPMLSVGDA
ncbi:BAR domain protein [Aspergillus clavatus NRRL 1]|uniref:BAR domain protein n=1 Tax=Aspergillus clavatus (strain ATCC 1007 / CBS 513.65 / DSM 816 / NCTC 3887 / NRRL 1 / QM 1276 / 107) TaxID=344612 RepID=A1C9X4_ASPCL|nr:BAR domain protein [Aspergillus clavatus NRRL 1]EAW12542.1 BAR domain protein [Aspergillus clavatus NRRL 1]